MNTIWNTETKKKFMSEMIFLLGFGVIFFGFLFFALKIVPTVREVVLFLIVAIATQTIKIIVKNKNNHK